MSYRMTLGIALLAVGLGGVVAAQPSAKPVRIRGEIVAVHHDTLTVKRLSGDDVAVQMKHDLAVNAVRNVPLDEVKPNAYVGVASRTGADGALTAIEVLVFPESGRGSGEGHYAWDLGENSTMTNANVDAAVQRVDGRQLTLGYAGGSKEIAVPAGTPIVGIVPAARQDLVTGRKVFIVATPAGEHRFTASRVVVEKDGVVPPM